MITTKRMSIAGLLLMGLGALVLFYFKENGEIIAIAGSVVTALSLILSGESERSKRKDELNGGKTDTVLLDPGLIRDAKRKPPTPEGGGSGGKPNNL